MSIATLKRKTAAKYNNNSVGQKHFSLNGGYRNQGWVGQSNLSRSLPQSYMRGDTLRGYGGCCGQYRIMPIVQSAVTSTNNNKIMKSSVLDYDGMIATQYRWIRRPQPYTSVKPDTTHNLNDQGEYISRLTQQTIHDINSCPPKSTHEIPPAVCNYDINAPLMFKRTLNSAQSFSAPCINITTKSIKELPIAITQDDYILELKSKCTNIDIQFQNLNNTTTQLNTPFSC